MADREQQKRLADMGWAVAEAVTLMNDALELVRSLLTAPELPDAAAEPALEKLGQLCETADLVLAVTASHIRQAAQPGQ